MSSSSPAPESIRIRIRNQIIINICSAVGTAISLGILAGILGVLGLLAQSVFHFVAIPTNLLAALALIGVGMFIVLLIIGVIIGLIRVWFGKHPGVALALVFGLLAFSLALHLEDKGARDKFQEALKKAGEGTKTQTTQQPPPPPQKEATK